MTHYIAENGDVYGFKPAEIASREMTDDEFQNFKCLQLSVDDAFLVLRSARDARLADTDKMLLPDYPIAADALEQVKAYRSAMRALPEQPGAPWPEGDIPWPTKPDI